MASKNKRPLNNNKTDEITVKTIRRPTKEDSTQKIKKLSEFLSKTWHMPLDSK